MDEEAKSPLTATTAGKDLKPSQRDRTQILPWLLDVACLIISLTCVLVVIGLLIRYNNQPVPIWHNITLNTLVGYLGQVAQICLTVSIANSISQLKWLWFWSQDRPKNVNDFQLYDSASRGPFGAIKMLRGAFKRPLTTLGALVMIATVVIHPFLQTIPSFETRLVPLNNMASIDRATKFDARGYNPSGADSALGQDVLDSESKGAVYAGLYGFSSSNTGVPTCPSGNCTWEPYTSLAVCSVCTNLSSLLVKTWNPTAYNGPDWEYSLQPPYNSPELTYDAAEESMIMSPLLTNQTRYLNGFEAYSISHTLSVWFGEGQYNDIGEGPAGAFECMLYFCVRTFSAVVRDGQFSEQVLSSFPNISTTRDDAEEGIRRGSPAPEINNVHDFENVIQAPGNGEQYVVDQVSLSLLQSWNHNLLIGHIDAYDDSMSDVAQILYASLLNNRSPAYIMSRIADSLTKHIRSASTQTATGTTMIQQIYVKARWGWAALPIVVIALTFVLVAATVFANARKKIPTWRSSTLPSLIYSLDASTTSDIAADGSKLSTLEEKASCFVMAISGDENGVRFLEGRK